MALGPRLDLRQSQSLVMTPQLQQAIKLLTLSNLEIETVIGEAIEPPKQDARQAGARERFATELSNAFTAMREEVVARFGLSPDDLPQTPQARKGEHP